MTRALLPLKYTDGWATLCSGVAGLHAAAALHHHYVLRDGVLRSMLPFGRG